MIKSGVGGQLPVARIGSGEGEQAFVVIAAGWAAHEVGVHGGHRDVGSDASQLELNVDIAGRAPSMGVSAIRHS